MRAYPLMIGVSPIVFVRHGIEGSLGDNEPFICIVSSMEFVPHF